MAKNNAPSKQSPSSKQRILKRITITGIIGVVFFVGINWYIYASTYSWFEAFIQTAIFLGVWWIVQILLNYRMFFPKDR
jgi:Fe2+ transport system protein B